MDTYCGNTQQSAAIHPQYVSQIWTLTVATHSTVRPSTRSTCRRYGHLLWQHTAEYGHPPAVRAAQPTSYNAYLRNGPRHPLLCGTTHQACPASEDLGLRSPFLTYSRSAESQIIAFYLNYKAVFESTSDITKMYYTGHAFRTPYGKAFYNCTQPFQKTNHPFTLRA
jgi:hypothetical protein